MSEFKPISKKADIIWNDIKKSKEYKSVVSEIEEFLTWNKDYYWWNYEVPVGWDEEYVWMMEEMLKTKFPTLDFDFEEDGERHYKLHAWKIKNTGISSLK